MNLKPLLTIWSRPTATMKYMKDHTSLKYSIMILALAAIASVGIQVGSAEYFPDLSLGWLIVMLIVSGFVGALISWVVGSAFYTWIGKFMFGGSGKYTEMLKVVPAVSIPLIWMAPFNYTVIAIYRDLVFKMPPEDSLAITYLPLTVYLLINFLTFALSIYGVVISCKGIGLVHNFSAWRGLGVVLVVLVAATIISIAVAFLFILFFAIGG